VTDHRPDDDLNPGAEGADEGRVTDLSRVLDELYHEMDPPAPGPTTPTAALRGLAGPGAEAGEADLTGAVPGPGPAGPPSGDGPAADVHPDRWGATAAAVATEREPEAAGFATPVLEPEPVPEAPTLVQAGPWRRTDDDILPRSAGRKGSRLRLR